jgi:hypothetical protein
MHAGNNRIAENGSTLSRIHDIQEEYDLHDPKTDDFAEGSLCGARIARRISRSQKVRSPRGAGDLFLRIEGGNDKEEFFSIGSQAG